jgi:hypothetical protein
MLLIRVKKPIDGYKEGDEVKVATDPAGIPLARSWRRALAAAELDGCCEIVKPRKVKRNKPQESNDG